MSMSSAIQRCIQAVTQSISKVTTTPESSSTSSAVGRGSLHNNCQDSIQVTYLSRSEQHSSGNTSSLNHRSSHSFKHTRRTKLATTIAAALTAACLALTPQLTAHADESAELTVQQVIARDGEALKATGLLDLSTPQQAQVLTQEEFEQTQDAQTAFVRLDNDKITFMAKNDEGKAEPFLSLAVETGFWDSRACGGPYTQGNHAFGCVTNPASPFYSNASYEEGMKQAFKLMKNEYHFNTVQITINWAEFDRTIDAANPVFDFTLLDDFVKWADEAGLKVLWVLFFHIQRNMPAYEQGFRPEGYTQDAAATAKKSVYNLADEGNYSYGIQWANSPVLKTVAGYSALHHDNQAVPELYPEYWHPVIFKQLMTALDKLAEHYKSSRSVIGYQLGNEEGLCGGNDYNYYNAYNSANPYYKAMFELWKTKTGGTDHVQFRKELGLSVWQAMVSAIRKQDPYKALTTNFQSSDVDKNPTNPANSGGQDLDFYRDAGLDLIAPMYYGGTENIRKNIDAFYGSSDDSNSMTAQELPLLFPSEIGIGWDRGVRTQSDILDTLARGGAGFGLYSFGEMLKNSRVMKQTVRSLMTMVTKYSHEFWDGQPVNADTTSNIHMTTTDSKYAISTLQGVDPNTALGVLWVDYGSDSSAGAASVRHLDVSVREAGTYRVEALINTNANEPTVVDAVEREVAADESIGLDSISLDAFSSAFIKVTKIA